jgi:hypothetical protein
MFKISSIKIGAPSTLASAVESDPMTLQQALALGETLKPTCRRVMLLAEHDDGVPENKGKFFLHQILK